MGIPGTEDEIDETNEAILDPVVKEWTTKVELCHSFLATMTESLEVIMPLQNFEIGKGTESAEQLRKLANYADDVSKSVERFKEAAEQLKDTFVALKLAVLNGDFKSLMSPPRQPLSHCLMLVDEITRLHNEIQDKDKRMLECSRTLHTWAERVKELKEQHTRTLAAV